jgi:hypothetical protein
VRIVGEVFLRRKITSHFSNGKIDWRQVKNQVRIADTMRETVLFGTVVGSSSLVSVTRELWEGELGGYNGRNVRV